MQLLLLVVHYAIAMAWVLHHHQRFSTAPMYRRLLVSLPKGHYDGWLFGQDEQLYSCNLNVCAYLDRVHQRLNEDFINRSLIAKFMFAPHDTCMTEVKWPISA